MAARGHAGRRRLESDNKRLGQSHQRFITEVAPSRGGGSDYEDLEQPISHWRSAKSPSSKHLHSHLHARCIVRDTNLRVEDSPAAPPAKLLAVAEADDHPELMPTRDSDSATDLPNQPRRHQRQHRHQHQPPVQLCIQSTRRAHAGALWSTYVAPQGLSQIQPYSPARLTIIPHSS
ncbi:hypothetical protein K402DRAFT_22993 [Aulographum hederae CBS 113979]|uniref:Uncharacterized protein n=1 Tax=Aulographum hederae CBS 113979 TaxID=1176131 RepID=A0A6G1H6Y5_9PEZI|nr:hypothetical protein K402DRAFT_22993 [Aulographum hederae CBS 113979]